MASLQIHLDQENNVTEHPKRPLRVNKASHVPLQLQNRPVLGAINKNLPRTRSQALQKPDQKLCQPSAKPDLDKQKPIFFIHEDNSEEEKKPKTTVPVCTKVTARLQDLPSTITSLHRPPLQELLDDEEDEEDDDDADDAKSSMSMDLSIRSFSAISVADKEPASYATLAHLMESTVYARDIYQYLLEAELVNRPRPYYMKKQPDISYSMRAILVDWLVEVAEEYNLQTETLYLAVSYLDRFLSLMSVVRSKLQLVGTAAMFVAAKYEEIYPPDVGEFVYITDDTYTKRQVLRMEHLILKVLGFDMSVPTVLGFIVNYCTTTKQSDSVLYLAMYLSELSLMEGDPFLDYLPSRRASAAICLARHHLYEAPAWSRQLQDASTYNLGEISSCIGELSIVHEAAPTHPQQAIREKYRSNARRNVSGLAARGVKELLV